MIDAKNGRWLAMICWFLLAASVVVLETRHAEKGDLGSGRGPAMIRGGVAPRRTVALLFDSLASSFWVESRASLKREAGRRGWSVLEAVSNVDDNRQYQQLEAMIARQVDGIIIIQTDNKAVIPAIRAANEAHIPIVHFNRPPEESAAYSVAVAADNRALMRESVLTLIEKARQRGGRYKAAILLGDLGDMNAVNRRDGFDDAVSRNSDVVEVVARIATEWNADKAFAGITNALQAHPDINMLVTSSDFLTPQIEQALRQAGKWKKTAETGHVLLAGFDGDKNGYEQLAAGYFDVDGVQNIDYEVALAFGAIERQLKGERPPKLLLDPGIVITQSNLGAKRNEMWGFRVWRAKAPVADRGAAVTGGTFKKTLTELQAAASAMFSVGSARDVFRTALPLAILVTGQMLVLVIGQIDLSMTAVMALGSIIGASVMVQKGAPGPECTLLGVAVFLTVGLAVGLFNGVCTVLFRMPSFVVTLSVMMAGSGAAVWYASMVSDTISVGGLPAEFRRIGYGSVAGVPFALLFCTAVMLIGGYVLSRTMVGRWIYAIGHNPSAAQISGVPATPVIIGVFAASGLCAALAAIIYTARMEAGSPILGQNQLLDIVGAAVIGGVSLFGGRGKMWMVAVGVLFLSILDKSLQVLGLSLFLVLAIKGVAILAATAWDANRRRGRANA